MLLYGHTGFVILFEPHRDMLMPHKRDGFEGTQVFLALINEFPDLVFQLGYIKIIESRTPSGRIALVK
jgi:hypothetical protein